MNVVFDRRLVWAVALLLALPALASAAPMAFETQVLSTGPYVYYRLGETSGTTAGDTSVNGRDGTYVGDPTLGVLGAGPMSDTAVTFVAADSQHVTSSNLAGFGSLMANSSFEFVFKTTNTTDQMSLFGVFNDGSTTGVEINLNRNAPGSGAANENFVRLFLRGEANHALAVAFQNAKAFDGDYHHLLFTYDSSVAGPDRIKAYLDGELQSLTDPGAGVPGTAGFADFAYDPAFAARNVRGPISQYFDGTLDEVALYARTLSAAEALAHASAALVPEPASLALLSLGWIAVAMFGRRRQ